MRLFLTFFMVFLLPLSAFPAVEYDLLPVLGRSGKWGYMDAGTRKMVISPGYRSVSFFDDGIALVMGDAGKWGLIDRTGREILSAQYDAVDVARLSYSPQKNVPGFFLVRQGDREGVFRVDGSWPLPLGKHQDISFYEEGYFRYDGSFWIEGTVYNPPSGYRISRIIRGANAFMIESESRSAFGRKKTGVMLFNGEILLKPEYDEIEFIGEKENRWVASRVDSGILGKVIRAVVTGRDIDVDDEKDMLTFWLLDERGNKMRQYRARYYPFVKDGQISYQSGGKEYGINPLNGEPLIREASRKVGNRYVIFQERGFWGVKNSEGQVLVEPQYVSMDSLGGDLFVVRQIEGLDRSVRAPEYDAASTYDENAGVINIANQVLMPFEYRSISSLRYPDRETAFFMVCKRVPVKDNPSGSIRCGMADRSGREIIPPQYQNSFHMNKIGQATVYSEDGYHGVIDYTGKVILPPVYRSIFDTAVLDKTAAVFYTAEKDKLWGVYDAKGKEIVPHRYGFISVNEADISQGWVKGDSPDRRYRGAYNYRTRVSVPAVYASISVYDQVLMAYRRAEGSRSRDEYDLLDWKGKTLATYDRLDALPSGRFIAGKEGLNGVLNARGKVQVPLKYRLLNHAVGKFLWAEDGNGNHFLVSESGEEFRLED